MTKDDLLTVLQRRFLALVTEDGADLTDEQSTQLRQLLTTLSVALHHGDGFVHCYDIPTVDMASLHRVAPSLLGGADQTTPIVYAPPFVALRRPFSLQMRLVHYLSTLPTAAMTLPTLSALQRIDWAITDTATLSTEQQRAAFTAASLPFTLITGGAGTGKTSTLSKALELILLDNPQATITLSAPTGKAADRLKESLSRQLSTVHPDIYPTLSTLSATTLHRLLGISESGGRAYRNAANPLVCDVLAIDEASMVSSELFERVRAAVLPQTKIILLGDANQLPPIDSTSFFNEISRLNVGYSATFCDKLKSIGQTQQPSPAPLPNAICHLTASRRFKDDELVGQAAQATLDGDADKLLTTLARHHAHHPIHSVKTLYQQLADAFPTAATAWREKLDNRMILCANRQGVWGSEQINTYLDNHFRQQFAPQTTGQSTWYVGRRVMIERNDYQLSLYNGDIGYCQRSSTDGWELCFDGDRRIPVDWVANNYRLAFAISIHKSQGSEYPHVDIVLGEPPSDTTTHWLSQPLLYTAITRAKQTLRVFANHGLIHHALNTTEREHTVLATLLTAFPNQTLVQQ